MTVMSASRSGVLKESDAQTIASRPIWLWIDPSQDCNLECKLCYALPGQKKLFLEPNRLRDILRTEA